jgi:predicted RNase H-like nuclease (RuvC/YqgF family)
MSGINTQPKAREVRYSWTQLYDGNTNCRQGGYIIPEITTPRKKRSRKDEVETEIEVTGGRDYTVKRTTKKARIADKGETANLEIIVGIDFGTTYSGMSCPFTTKDFI